MEINDLPINAAPTADLYLELSDGKRATLANLPLPDSAATLLSGKQPLDADLTSYANAADAAARRTLIGAEASGAAATVQGNLTTHTADTTAHGATSANTASRIVARSATGTATLSGVQLDTAATPANAVGLIRWNGTDKTAEIVTEGGVALQLGQEETVYVRNNSGVTIANGEAVYVTGATGQRPTIAKATGTSASGQKMMGLVTTDAGIANNAFGFVTINGIVHGLNTSAFTDGAELYLSPTTAGALTATVPSGAAQRIVRVGYVVHAHANQGTVLVKTHYQGTPLGNSVMEAEGAAAARTALGLGSLATQSGTFSGTSSGTNTGDNVAATESVSGIVELATLAEVATGTDAARAVTPAGVRSAFLSLLPDGYLNSDGATTNRAAGIYGPFDAVNNPREWVAGAATLTDFIQWTVPTVNPSADILLVTRGAGSGGNYPWGVSNSMGVWMDPSGNLSIAANGAVWATNKREFVRSGFRSTYSGQTVLLSFYLTNGTSNPVVKLNGVDISSSFSVGNGASPVNWLDSAMVPTYRHVGYNWPAGPAPLVTPILGQTSAEDDAFYLQTGKWPAWVVAGGAPVSILSDVSRNGNFSAVATDWRGFGTSTVTLNTSTQALDVVATNGGCRLGSAGNPFNVALSGRGVVFKVVLSNVSGGTVGCYNAAGGGFFQSFASGLTNGTHYITVSPLNKNGASDVDIAFGGAGISFTIDDFVPVLAGALSLPSVQPINVLDDVSGIGGNQGRLLGCTGVTDKHSTRILGRINAASATNQQILGGAVLPVPLNHGIEFVDAETDGSVTLSLGDGTTATRYTASTALTAGRTRIALTTPFAADAAKTGLYVNVTSTGGTYAQFSILGHLLK